MKIDSSKPASTSSSPSGAARTRAGQGGAASTSGDIGTAATLSGAMGVESALASAPEVDSSRVAEIKQAISEGRFQVNPERIADGLLQSVRDMLAAGS